MEEGQDVSLWQQQQHAGIEEFEKTAYRGKDQRRFQHESHEICSDDCARVAHNDRKSGEDPESKVIRVGLDSGKMNE